jgi:hypothetical protein
MVKSFFTDKLTANQQPTNIMGGDANEFVPFDALILVRAVTSGASATITLFADQDLLIDQKPIPYVGTSLVDKDHVINEFSVNAGTRLMIKLGETAGATPTVLTGIEIIPE